MKELYDEVARLTDRDDGNIQGHLNKFFEEAGELAQIINKMTGRKSRDETDTPKSMWENLAGEIADNIQLLFCLAHLQGIPYDEIKYFLKVKNEMYRRFLNEKDATK